MGGANVDLISERGQCALSVAVCNDNKKMAEMLTKRNAKMFISDMEHRDKSPFFQAIND